jgi:hypothetical protein
MPDDSLSKRLALINTLLRPIQKTIRELLPDFIDRNLKSKTVRAAIVDCGRRGVGPSISHCAHFSAGNATAIDSKPT